MESKSQTARKEVLLETIGSLIRKLLNGKDYEERQKVYDELLYLYSSIKEKEFPVLKYELNNYICMYLGGFINFPNGMPLIFLRELRFNELLFFYDISDVHTFELDEDIALTARILEHLWCETERKIKHADIA